jgi:hypothetical protein
VVLLAAAGKTDLEIGASLNISNQKVSGSRPEDCSMIIKDLLKRRMRAGNTPGQLFQE